MYFTMSFTVGQSNTNVLGRSCPVAFSSCLVSSTAPAFARPFPRGTTANGRARSRGAVNDGMRPLVARDYPIIEENGL